MKHPLRYWFWRFYAAWSSATIHHHCPEIRGPIYLPKRLASIIAQGYPNKVLKHDGIVGWDERSESHH